MTNFNYDIIVLGAGPGGLTVAKNAAALGFKVGLVEKGKLDNIGDLEKVSFLPGFASFVDKHTVDVDGEKITAKKFCIATGSRPAIPPFDGLKEVGYLTCETISKQKKLPESIMVLGGSPTGLELAQSLARSGCKVVIIEPLEHLLPQNDPEVGSFIEQILKNQGVELALGAKLKKCYAKDNQKAALVEHNGQEKEIIASEILVTAGRIPSIQGLDLKLAKVEYTKKGITVDNRLRTSTPNIWACGDIIGDFQSTQTAIYQAKIVAANMIFRFSQKVNYDFVPWAIFTDPEIANVGLTERMAKEKGLRYETVKFEFKDLDRAICDDTEKGFLKLLIKKGKIIGVVCVGPDAANIIHELILAANTKLPLHKIAETIHIYPTLAQINLKAAEKYLKKDLSPFTKKLARLIFNLFS